MDLAEQVFASVETYIDMRTKTAAATVAALAARVDAVEQRPDDVQKFVTAFTAKLLA